MQKKEENEIRAQTTCSIYKKQLTVKRKKFNSEKEMK